MNSIQSKRPCIQNGLSVVLFVTLLAALPARAQLAGANLSGVVMDTSGSSVPNAMVSIKNVSTGVIREVQSNSDGLYSAPNLSPGDYDIEASARSFSKTVVKGVTLTVGSERALNLTLKVGAVNLVVQVTELPPLVETSSSTLSATVERKTIVDLPLNGRDWTLLATLQPGVIAVRAQATTGNSANRGNRGFGNQLADSGHRPYENTYRVDGISINDYTNGAPGSVLGVTLGVDAIQEFNVVTSNYTAEYGRTSGAVINSVTKSGTNNFHGSSYFFDRPNHQASLPPYSVRRFSRRADHQGQDLYLWRLRRDSRKPESVVQRHRAVAKRTSRATGFRSHHR